MMLGELYPNMLFFFFFMEIMTRSLWTSSSGETLEPLSVWFMARTVC